MTEASEALIKIAAAAKIIGVNRSTLLRQVKEGSVRSHKGKVRLSEVLEDRANNIDLSRSKRRTGEIDVPEAFVASTADATNPAGVDATNLVDVEDEPAILVDGKALPFKEAGALKETYLARLRQLEYDLKVGEVVRIDVVIGVLVEQLAKVRNKLLNIGVRVAPKAAILKSAEEVSSIIQAEVILVLEELTLDCEGMDLSAVRTVLKDRFGHVDA